MREEKKQMTINGSSCRVRLLIFEESDRPWLRRSYDMWQKLSSNMRRVHARAINLPEGISESAFCLEYGTARILDVKGGESSSFDTINLKNGNRQQIKATSIEDDLTSFGPKSVWDDLYFLDFFRKGAFDRSFDVYKIPDDLIYNHKINRTETFRDQQKKGLRPRFGIKKKIIKEHAIQPERTCRI